MSIRDIKDTAVRPLRAVETGELAGLIPDELYLELIDGEGDESKEDGGIELTAQMLRIVKSVNSEE